MYFQTEYYPYSQSWSYHSSCVHWLSQKLPYTWLTLKYLHFYSGISDVPSSLTVPNNNCHSQTSNNSNTNSPKNVLAKYFKRCRRAMRSAFLRLRRWVSEHHGVLVWRCYCILRLFMFTDISAIYLFPYVHIHVCILYCILCNIVFAGAH